MSKKNTHNTRFSQDIDGHAHCYIESVNTNNTTVAKVNEPYTVIGDNMISVCMKCFPHNSILQLFPDMDGVEISHGICAAHKQVWLKELDLLRSKKQQTELVAA